jgi:hypothetical protein
MFRMRSGAENSMQMDLQKQEAYTEHLQRAVQRAIKTGDVSGLQAALDAYTVWGGGGYTVIDQPDSKQVKRDKSEL